MFNLSKLAKGIALSCLVSSVAQANVDDFKSVGYFPSWSGQAQHIQYDKLTHINYSFLLLNRDGTLQPIANPQKLRHLVELAHASGVKVGIAVGGWNGSRANEFETMSSTAAGRTQFVTDILKFVEQYQLDGVDMDWEYPDSGQTADNFALLMDELSKALRSQDKFLTAAVAASGWGARGIKAEVFDDVDFLNLMAYDADHSAGQHHSTYEFAEQSIAYWQSKGLSKEKTVLGVPFYAQPARTYRDIIASEPNAACKDKTQSGAGYNGIPTIQKKTRLALAKAGGIMNWELSQDTQDETSLLHAIDQAINGEVSTVCATAPTPSPTVTPTTNPSPATPPPTDCETNGTCRPPLELTLLENNQAYENTSQSVVASYFVEWGIYGRKFPVSSIPAQNLSHIIYGFIPICGPNAALKEANPEGFSALQRQCKEKQDFEVTIHDSFAALEKSFPGDKWDDPIKGNFGQLMRLKAAKPEIKILPSIGGWTLSDPFYFMHDEHNRATFVESVHQFLLDYPFFDGVDIDWEYPGGEGANSELGQASDKQLYALLMKDLRTMLDQLSSKTGRDYELTSAVGVGQSKVDDVDYAEASQYMDYIFAMTYDFYGTWDNQPGHHAGLYQSDSGALAKFNGHDGISSLMAAGVPANKLVMGVAMYGRGWKGINGYQNDNPFTGTANGKVKGTWEDGVLDYRDISTNFAGAKNQGKNGYQYYYDEQAQSPYLWNKETGSLITYDDARSAKEKAIYAKSNGLAGVFSWEIDADNGDILNAIHQGLGHGAETPTLSPTLQPSVEPSVEPSPGVTVEPSINPTIAPTITPTQEPTLTPTEPPVNSLEWHEGTIYLAGDVVTFQSKSYQAKWWTQGNQPGATQWGPWRVLTKQPEVTPVPVEPTSTPTITPEQPQPTAVPTIPAQWQTETIYQAGQQVSWQGETYQAQWWTQGQTPNDSNPWGVWQKNSQ